MEAIILSSRTGEREPPNDTLPFRLVALDCMTGIRHAGRVFSPSGMTRYAKLRHRRAELFYFHTDTARNSGISLYIPDEYPPAADPSVITKTAAIIVQLRR